MAKLKITFKPVEIDTKEWDEAGATEDTALGSLLEEAGFERTSTSSEEISKAISHALNNDPDSVLDVGLVMSAHEIQVLDTENPEAGDELELEDEDDDSESEA